MLRGAVLALTILLAPAVQAAGPYGEIVVGNWKGGAFTSDATGAFSHCAVNAGYRNGTRMFTSITGDLKWLIGFAHPNWKLPGESQLINAFRHGRILELVANDQRLTFALTSTGEMLPALVACAKQSEHIRGPVNPAAGQNAAKSSEAEIKAKAEKRAVLEKTRDLIRTRMLTCIGREGGPMLATDEKAEVVAKAAMIFCKADVDALAQAIIEIHELDGTRPVDRDAVRRIAAQSVQDVVVAQIVKSRGEMLSRRNQAPAPSTPSGGGRPAISPSL